MAEKFRITYATMSADNEELQAAYDEAAERARARARQGVPGRRQRRRALARREVRGALADRLPTSSIGRFSQATTQDVDDAVAAAKAFQLEWDRMGWQERVRILRNVADIMEDRVYDLAALMAYEVGKNRLEALGDVQETAELIRWNCRRDGRSTTASGSR